MDRVCPRAQSGDIGKIERLRGRAARSVNYKHVCPLRRRARVVFRRRRSGGGGVRCEGLSRGADSGVL